MGRRRLFGADCVATLEWWSKYLLIVAIPYFLVLMAVEIAVIRRARRAGTIGYEWRDSATSITLGLIKLIMLTVCAGYTAVAFAWVYEHRVFTLSPFVWWTWLLLFVADDFTYYWYHRFAHRVRVLWCEHVNHHSSQHFNLSTALRQSTLGPAFIFVYWLPLAWLGFHPLAIAVQLGISLVYQYWIHTEALQSLGWFERVLNTPSHHRVHHGSNGIYLDRNYAGILIVWDKLFGTFQPERADTPVRYGLVHDIHTFNLFRVIFHEVGHMLARARQAKGLRNKLGWIFGPPEWTPDGPAWPPDHPQYRARPAVAFGEKSLR
jgi:sterol desaturase/sphingolipid hydroxylase (fatty acid hydroxylase superfamily)